MAKPRGVKKNAAFINPAILKWARESTKLDIPSAAKAAGLSNPDSFLAAEDGSDHLTLRQLQAFAKRCRISVTAFYLKEPPQEAELPTNFRSKGASPTEYDTNLLTTIRSARERRDAALELYRE